MIRIEDLQIGDLVYSYDEESKSVVEQEIIHLIESNKKQNIFSILLENGSLVQTTTGHPFYVADKWTIAENLNIDDYLLSIDDENKLIRDISSKITHEKVYNLTVANTHNYFVGEEQVLAHNASCRIPHRSRPRLEEGNSKEGWIHIKQRHIPGGGTEQGDLFASGTSFFHLEQAAVKIISKGKRMSDPNKRLQRFEKKMVINGKKANYRIIVDSDDNNRVITMFPIEGGG